MVSRGSHGERRPGDWRDLGGHSAVGQQLGQPEGAGAAKQGGRGGDEASGEVVPSQTLNLQ